MFLQCFIKWTYYLIVYYQKTTILTFDSFNLKEFETELLVLDFHLFQVVYDYQLVSLNSLDATFC